MKQLKILLGEPVYPHEKFHIQTMLDQKNCQSYKVHKQIVKKNIYKAYARLPEVILDLPLQIKSFHQAKPKRYISFQKRISTLLFHLGKKLKKDPFFSYEIYLYSLKSSKLDGLFHYYHKKNILEKLPLTFAWNQNEYLLEKLKKIPIFFLVFSVRLDLFRFPKGERLYRTCLLNLGQILGESHIVDYYLNLFYKEVDFYDNAWNNLIRIDGLKETVIHVAAYYENKVNLI